MPTLHREKIETKRRNLTLSIAHGHLATGIRHCNHYIDVVSQKSNLTEARAVAQELCSGYRYHNTPIDTVVCLDGTEVIGVCIADELSKSDISNINSQKSMNVVTPEIIQGAQLLFRDNLVPMIRDKNVLVTAVSVASGKTARIAIEAINYYGGKVAGVAAIFSTTEECQGVAVNSVFNPNDLEGYGIYRADECPMCKQGKKLDALINSHGYSKI